MAEAVALQAYNIISALLKIRAELKENQAEGKRLVDRVEILQNDVNDVSTGYRPDVSEVAMRTVLATVQECRALVEEFSQTSWWGSANRLLSRSDFTKRFADANRHVSEAMQVLAIEALLSAEQRRKEDLDDQNKGFAAMADGVIAEMRDNQDASEERHRQLQDEIRAMHKKVIDQMLELNGHAPLDKSELREMGAQVKGLQEYCSAQFGEVKSGIESVAAKQDRVLHLLEAKVLSPDQTALREEKLKAIGYKAYSELSFAEEAGEGIKGGFGTVKLGSCDGAKVALKIMAGNREMAEKEAILMHAVHASPYITQILGVCDAPERAEFVLVLEWADYGSVSSVVENNVGDLRASLLLAWICDLARGAAHLHKLFVKHKDIKGANLLLFQGLRAKICDFGLSRQSTAKFESHAPSQIGAGTDVFMAPEAHSSKSTPQSDVYSIGTTIIQIVTGRPPQGGDSEGQMRKALQLLMRDLQQQSVVATTTLTPVRVFAEYSLRSLPTPCLPIPAAGPRPLRSQIASSSCSSCTLAATRPTSVPTPTAQTSGPRGRWSKSSPTRRWGSGSRGLGATRAPRAASTPRQASRAAQRASRAQQRLPALRRAPVQFAAQTISRPSPS